MENHISTVKCEHVLVERVSPKCTLVVQDMSHNEIAQLPDESSLVSDPGYFKRMRVMKGHTKIAVSIKPCKGQWRLLMGRDSSTDASDLLYRVSPKGANVWIDEKYTELMLVDPSSEGRPEVVRIDQGGTNLTKLMENKNLTQ